MAELTLRLKVISPMFLNGSNPRENPELRASSIRGQLRYWFRAIEGARTAGIEELWQRESAVFGSTQNGSPVIVRVAALSSVGNGEFEIRPSTDVLTSREPMLPHRRGTDKPPSPAPGIKIGQQLLMTCSTRPGVAFPEGFIEALITFLQLGGVGKRSRRMFGAIRLIKVEKSENFPAERLPRPKTPEDYAQWIRSELERALPANKPLANWLPEPSFPTLHPRWSQIIVGQLGFTSAEEANRTLFLDLLRTNEFRRYEYMFGFAARNRRASPVIAQVRRMNNEYYPVLTAMRSPIRPPNANSDWSIVDRFMEAAKEKFDGILAWGEGRLS